MSKKTERTKENRAILELIIISKKIEKLTTIAITAMKANRALTWAKANKEPTETEKRKQNEEKYKEFIDALKEIPQKNLHDWTQRVQLAYIKNKAPKQIFYYLGGNERDFGRLGYRLEKSADEYVKGWKLLGHKDREELLAPLFIVSPYELGLPVTDNEGILCVQLLISKLKKGNWAQKEQAKIVEKHFEKIIARLGKKMPEKGFILGEILGNNA
jgi:hypothetical protein